MNPRRFSDSVGRSGGPEQTERAVRPTNVYRVVFMVGRTRVGFEFEFWCTQFRMHAIRIPHALYAL